MPSIYAVIGHGSLAWKQYAIVESPSINHNYKMMKMNSLRSIATTSMDWQEFCKVQNLNGIIVEPLNYTTIVQLLKCKEPFKTLIVCSNCYKSIEQILIANNDNALGLYLTDKEIDNEPQIIHSFKGQNIVVKYPLRGKIDLFGAEISMINSRWPPYFDYNCVNNTNDATGETTSDCNYWGILPDSIRILSAKFNFTFKMAFNPIWGHMNMSHQDTVFSNMEQGNYDFSPGPWAFEKVL